MELIKILINVYEAKNEVDLFDSICYLQNFVEQNDNKEFLEEKISKENEKFFILKNEYTIQFIHKIFENDYFLKSVSNILKYQKEYKELKSVPEKILKQGYFINLSLNSCFYFVSLFSAIFKQRNLDFIGDYFWSAIKNLEKNFLYEFSKVDILNAFEHIIFDHQYFFQKEFPININGDDFYYNFKKSRLIIGNYLTDFSIPILLSNSFKKIISTKKELGGKLSSRYSFSVLKSALKKYEFLSGSFMFGDLGVDNKNEINSFEYYFSVRESRKILFLINSVVRDLSIFNKDEVLRKIDNSGSNLNEIKEFFYKNYNIFPDYKGPKVEGQWGNKSFLNTIKFFSVLDATKNSTDIQWKTDVFLKHLGDWIDDLHDNINYFSELDDYDQISSFLRSGENNEVEFKSTFGLPLQGYENQSALKGIRADIIDKVAKTILAMANSSGGKIFIGIIEKAGKVNSDLKTNIVERDGISFLDINFSLKEEKEDFDNKRLALQQVLKNLTKERMDFLDSLFSFRFYKIYIESKKSHIEILTIHIKKANKNIFIEKDNWITLPKRLNGRVELVNPADELQKE